jgi:hypothetical protein
MLRELDLLSGELLYMSYRFHYFFIFHFTLYQVPSMGPICHFIKIYSYEILF